MGGCVMGGCVMSRSAVQARQLPGPHVSGGMGAVGAMAAFAATTVSSIQFTQRSLHCRPQCWCDEADPSRPPLLCKTRGWSQYQHVWSVGLVPLWVPWAVGPATLQLG